MPCQTQRVYTTARSRTTLRYLLLRVSRTPDQHVLRENLAAAGYGPTLCAALIQMASDDSSRGIRLPEDPAEIRRACEADMVPLRYGEPGASGGNGQIRAPNGG